MLKRLNFLKNSLDGHSSNETATKIRIKALKRRDERLYEIWKNELEFPKVHDILQSI